MKEIYRQFVMKVPADLEPVTDADHAALSERVGPAVQDQIMRAVAKDSPHPVYSVPEIMMVVTCELDRIDSLPFAADCVDQGGCPECLKGRDWAKTYLMEHPGHHLIVGLVTVQVLEI